MRQPGSGVLTSALAELGSAVWAFWRGVAGLRRAVSTAEPFGERRLARSMRDYIWRPLTVLAVLGMLTGVIAGLLSADLLKRFHVELAVVPPIAHLLAAQIAPILVGVFAAGRVSVALASRFGGMQFQGDADALTLRGREPAAFVLGPVMLTLLVGAPILTLLVDAAMSLGVGAMLQKDALVPARRFLQLLATSDMARNMLSGVGRSYVYLLLAAATGGASGSAPIRDLSDLEHRTTGAFTAGLLAIFVAAAVMAT